jgi:hypothetical protein
VSEKEEIPIYSYTAKQAVEDGVLIEVNQELSKEAGYRWPVRITQGVSSLATPTEHEQRQGQSFAGRLWDILWMARVAISSVDSHEHVAPFDIAFGRKTVRLWACLDTTSGPAIHVITPQEY